MTSSGYCDFKSVVFPMEKYVNIKPFLNCFVQPYALILSYAGINYESCSYLPMNSVLGIPVIEQVYGSLQRFLYSLSNR